MNPLTRTQTKCSITKRIAATRLKVLPRFCKDAHMLMRNNKRCQECAKTNVT